jgi:hypothetical protein
MWHDPSTKFILSTAERVQDEGGQNTESSLTRTTGDGSNYGPPTFGSVDRRPENASAEKAKTCETAETQLTLQLTPKSRKQRKIDTSELTPEFADIPAVWPKLPDHIKATIKALLQTQTKGD